MLKMNNNPSLQRMNSQKTFPRKGEDGMEVVPEAKLNIAGHGMDLSKN